MNSARFRGLAAVIAMASVTAVAACSSSSGSADSSSGGEKVTIKVEGWRPGDKQPTIDAVKAQAAAFNQANPGIVVEPVEWEWKAETFAAQLAGNQLPTTFRVPFTDTKGLAERKQIADVTDLVNKLPYANKFNPNVLAAAKGPDGRIYGIPTEAYGVGLHYNRDLFTQAGLDPNKPPTTWDEVRAYAKQIADKTGQAGYVQMTKDNTGGWMLTTLTYSQGGRMEQSSGEQVSATVNNPGTKAGLELLKAMKWQDKSMGNNTVFDWGSINTAFAAGKVGMYMSGSDVYNALVTTNQIKPEMYGLAALPLASSADAGILGGGSVAAVNAKATPAEQDAAIKWNDFYRMRKLVDQEAAVADAKVLSDAKQPIGTPSLPVFDKATWEESRTWIKDYINVPEAQMTSFTDNVFDQNLIAEPASQTQALYALLDSVVQKVLTDQNADIDALLAAANEQATKLLSK